MDSIIYLISFLYFIYTASTSIYSQPKLDFLTNYQITSVKINFFEEKNETEAIRTGDLISVQFHAYGKDFQIFLRQDNSVCSPYTNTIIDGHNSISMDDIPGALIYEGIVEGFQQSVVNGYFEQSAFVGKMDLKNEIYYIEMASRYINGEDYKNKVIIYRESDIYPIEGKVEDEIFFNRTMNVENDWKTFRDKLKTRNKLTCEIALLADHTFVKSKKTDKATVIAEMLYHIKIMDKTFSSIDLDENLVPEGIGFSVEEINIIENESDPNYPLNKNFSNHTLFLQEMRENYKQNWCMFIVFSHRNFIDILGTAYVASICSGSLRKNIRSSNVGFVTDISYGRRIPKFRVSFALTHEMGHAFGSRHDNTNNIICSPGIKNPSLGHYIMYPMSIRNMSDGSRFNNWKFSPCSIKEMNEAIPRIGSCLLRNKNSKCGNGITEFGEECDCGPVRVCSKLDPCCNPPGSPNECMLKTHSGNYCSPREGDCCTDTCQIIPKEKNHPCFVYTLCSNNTATCDGQSPFCPEIPLLDGTLCFESSFTCHFGHCINNVCQSNGLIPCKCPIEKECQVCCININGSCTTTKDLNLLKPNGDFYKLIPGTPCNKNKGMCLRNGICSSFLDKKPKSAEPPTIRRKSNNWLYFLLIPFFLLLLVYPVYRVYRYLKWKNSLKISVNK